MFPLSKSMYTRVCFDCRQIHKYVDNKIIIRDLMVISIDSGFYVDLGRSFTFRYIKLQMTYCLLYFVDKVTVSLNCFGMFR